MRATPIELPPEVEPYVRRRAIGEGQPEYTVIPAIQVPTPSPYSHLVGMISRWEFTREEKNAIARSELRGMLIAFVTWLAGEIERNGDLRGDLTDMIPVPGAQSMTGEDLDVVLATAAHKFIREHASQLEGDDAVLWYTRMKGAGDPYQPQMMEISTTPPLTIEVDDSPTMPVRQGPEIVLPPDRQVH